MSNALEAGTSSEVFDVANWLQRANTNTRPAATDYTPRHRADVPVDHVA